MGERQRRWLSAGALLLSVVLGVLASYLLFADSRYGFGDTTTASVVGDDWSYNWVSCGSVMRPKWDPTNCPPLHRERQELARWLCGAALLVGSAGLVAERGGRRRLEDPAPVG